MTGKQLSSRDSAVAMLRDLDAVEVLAASLEGTAPITVAEAGGAQALIAKHGHRTGAWFWSIAPIPDALWEKMADEHQRKHRVSVGER
jgi:hypothetical protein